MGGKIECASCGKNFDSLSDAMMCCIREEEDHRVTEVKMSPDSSAAEGLIRKKVEELYETIRKAQDQLAEIKKVCCHTRTHIGLWGFDVSHAHPAVICDLCDQFVRSCTQEELEIYYQDVRFVPVGTEEKH